MGIGPRLVDAEAVPKFQPCLLRAPRTVRWPVSPVTSLIKKAEVKSKPGPLLLKTWIHRKAVIFSGPGKTAKLLQFLSQQWMEDAAMLGSCFDVYLSWSYSMQIDTSAPPSPCVLPWAPPPFQEKEWSAHQPKDQCLQEMMLDLLSQNLDVTALTMSPPTCAIIHPDNRLLYMES